MADDSSIPRGRLQRLGRMAGLATQVGAGLATDRVRRLLGRDASTPTALAQKALETLGSLKGGALKVGQTLSLFSHQLPPEVRAVLGQLFSRAPTLPFADIARAVEAELGGPLSAHFASFEEEPLAAASLGQVHGAVLRTGERVAVKVQYPHVAAALEADLRNLDTLLQAVGLGGALLDGRAYADEVRREVAGELDYLRELAFLERFRGHLSRWPDLVVPRAFPQLCTRKLLVLERLEGPTLSEVGQQADALPPEVRARLGGQLVRTVLGPWLHHGAIHADVHPGNYLALPDGRLGVLDFGCVKVASPSLHAASRALLAALAEGRRADWVALHRQAGFTWSISDARLQGVLEDILALTARPLCGPYDFSADRTVQQLADLKVRYPLDLLRIQPPPEGIMVGRALAGLLQNLVGLKATLDVGALLRAELQAA